MRENSVIAAGHLFRGIVLAQIVAMVDEQEMKARIMIAREHGHIDDDMCADLIAIHELADA
ncbi:hypothetical protein [Novosphingobium sp.]|uniref:hypothetical protein n=1 Tax=Novosphingobium sp. TaxID=1874826 RepID=UPI003D109EC1